MDTSTYDPLMSANRPDTTLWINFLGYLTYSEKGYKSIVIYIRINRIIWGMQTLSNVCNRAYMEVVLQYEDMMCLSWYKYIWNAHSPLLPLPLTWWALRQCRRTSCSLEAVGRTKWALFGLQYRWMAVCVMMTNISVTGHKKDLVD